MPQASEKDYGDVQIAARVIEIRESTGMSMEAFASILGVSQPTQSRIERAKRMPDVGYLRALRDRFDVDLNKLICGAAKGREGNANHQIVTGNANIVATGNANIVAGGNVASHAASRVRPGIHKAT